MSLAHQELTDQIINAFYEVYNKLINYLKATRCEVGLVLNFGPEPKFERRYFSNARKKHLSANPR